MNNTDDTLRYQFRFSLRSRIDCCTRGALALRPLQLHLSLEFRGAQFTPSAAEVVGKPLVGQILRLFRAHLPPV